MIPQSAQPPLPPTDQQVAVIIDSSTLPPVSIGQPTTLPSELSEKSLARKDSHHFYSDMWILMPQKEVVLLFKFTPQKFMRRKRTVGFGFNFIDLQII